MGPGLTRRECHLDRPHILDIGPWKVASLFGALVVPEEPAKALRLLHTALLIVLHGKQRGLADSQEVSRLQIQVLFLVLGKCVQGEILKTFCCHFVRVAKSKWPPNTGLDDAARVPLQQQGSAIQKSSVTKKAVESLNSGFVLVRQLRGSGG